MAFSFSRIKNWNAGETLTAADLNGEFDNILANATPASIGAQTLDATLTALAALTLTQGGIFTASGADTPVVLAKGAANTKLFINAGATAPEWAAGLKIGTFTRAMDAESGDVAYTGVGFKPSVILFLSNSGTVGGGMGIGVDNATNHYCVYVYGTTPGYAAVDTKSIALIEDGTPKNQTAIVKTLDADGFTLTWTREGGTASATATVFYLALR